MEDSNICDRRYEYQGPGCYVWMHDCCKTHTNTILYLVNKNWITPTPIIELFHSEQNTGENSAPQFGPRKYSPNAPSTKT
jgi:hypothetical protein